MLVSRKIKVLLYTILPILIAFIWNEYLIYHYVISKCSFPEIIHRTRGKYLTNDYTKIMILSDPHLLGKRNGHWLDKLRREWQMRRSFQAAISWLDPEAVFFLGDIFDEGQWASDDEFDIYADRFNELFNLPESIKRYVVVGNHDAGFHYAIMPPHLKRFAKKFNTSQAVDHVEINGNHFVLLNSMAMEGDGCTLCHEAEVEIQGLKRRFDCSLSGNCESNFYSNYSRPILMQHFPLYRESDEVCEDADDLAPEEVRKEKFREKWECISEESTRLLINSFHPRAVFGGHSHFTCYKWWGTPFNFNEYTVASFSWRNNRWPSFLLLTVSPNELKVTKCMIPHEYTVFKIYGFSIVCSLFIFVYQIYQCIRKKQYHAMLIENDRSPPKNGSISKID